jgi:segregation and condensation protein B
MEMTLKPVIEALLFASAKPMGTGEIVSALQSAGERAEQDGLERDLALLSEDEVGLALFEMQKDYEATSRGFQLVEQVNGWALVTNPFAAPWVRRLYPEAKPTRLSGPALETLAIIAYRQPVTRADIEAVRGVAVDGVMQVLLDRSLVKIAGRAEVPGRPLLYSTTEFFLQHFGLKTVEELPNSSELKRIALPKPAEGGSEAPAASAEPVQATPAEPAPENPETTAAEADAVAPDANAGEPAPASPVPEEEPAVSDQPSGTSVDADPT